MRDRQMTAVVWAGTGLATVGLLLPWFDGWPRTVLGIVAAWDLLWDRAAYRAQLAPLGAAALLGPVAAVTAALRHGPRWLLALAAVATATLPTVVLLHEVATRGFTVVGLGAGVPVTLAAAVLLGVAAARHTATSRPDHAGAAADLRS